jgi:hypothetical protein
VSLDLTGEPFCAECAAKSYGLYNFNCRRCEARSYIRAPPNEQRRASKVWRQTMTAVELDEMKRLIDEERTRERARESPAALGVTGG